MSRIGKCNYMMENGRRCGDIAVFKIACDDRGGRNQCFCERHRPYGITEYDSENIESYFAENHAEIGTRPALYKGMTYSVELETMRPDEKAYSELSNLAFLPTKDGTVDCEFKSPIYASLKSPVRVTKSIQKLINNGNMAITDECGTHFHCGLENDGMVIYMPIIRRFYHSFFVALCNEMKLHPAENAAIFGRNFAHWAQVIDSDTHPENHSNFINVQHSFSLEWRIMKFVNNSQYAAAMMLCRDMSLIVIETAEKMVAIDGTVPASELRQLAREAGDRMIKRYRKELKKH